MLNAIGAFPTWAITNVVIQFVPKSHPWHGRTFSLRYWHAHQTPLCRSIDVLFYLSVASFVITLALLYR